MPGGAQRSSTEDVVWKNAFIVGSLLRDPAESEALTVRGGAAFTLYLVLEGERNELPVYCTRCPEFRIRGRAIPKRLVLAPQDVGLREAEIHWVEIRPVGENVTWKQSRLPSGEKRWRLEVTQFPGDETLPQAKSLGTARFAVAVQVDDGSGSRRVLASRGFDPNEDWSDPRYSPGYRVTRYADETLPGRATAFTRLPVTARASDAHVLEKIAIRPVDLVLGAYEDYGGQLLPSSRRDPIDGDAWSWLFEPVYEKILRRQSPGVPLVSPRGQGIPWADLRQRNAPGVRRGDVLMSGNAYALLDRDDGDGWLGGADKITHSETGAVASGELDDLPGSDLKILRFRNFVAVRQQLEEAGYGKLGGAFFFGPEVRKACREFQLDRGMPDTGIPDEATLESLSQFLATMRSYDGTEVEEGSP